MSEEKEPTDSPEPTRFDIHFVKRPDLRPDEFPPDLEPEEFNAAKGTWNFLIDMVELGDEIAGDDPTVKVWPSMVALRPFTSQNEIEPIKLLEFFCGCHESKVYPPGWIMTALTDIFKRYLTAREKGEHKTLGEFFGESRHKDWQRVISPVLNAATMDVHRLREWFDCSRDDALAIVACKLEECQTPARLPAGWRKRVKIKGRKALEKAYDTERKSIEQMFTILTENGRPTEDERNALLQRLGEEALVGKPHLIDRLRQIKPTKS